LGQGVERGGLMPEKADTVRRIKWMVTALAGLGLIVHVVFPDVKVDAVSLGFLALALLPWLSPLIKSAELPGGVKIEFQDVQVAAEKVAAGEPAANGMVEAQPEPAFVAIASQDSSLAVVGLRIEIEKRIRQLAERAHIPANRPLSQLTHDLQRREILHAEAVAGLRDLIALGNLAAHGREVSPDAAYSAIEYGPKVLRVLDGKLRDLGGKEPT
jgi:hypothetical protein